MIVDGAPRPAAIIGATASGPYPATAMMNPSNIAVTKPPGTIHVARAPSRAALTGINVPSAGQA